MKDVRVHLMLKGHQIRRDIKITNKYMNNSINSPNMNQLVFLLACCMIFVSLFVSMHVQCVRHWHQISL